MSSNDRESRVSVVYFDLDGTLLDTTYLHTLAWWRACAAAGQTRPMAEIHRLIGMGGAELLEELLGQDDDSIREDHRLEFERLQPSVTPLPGASDLLRAVRAQGGRVVIVSSTPGSRIGPLLELLDCDDVVETVVHGEAAARAKPSPDLFEVALDRTGDDPGGGVAVGDAVWDVEAAVKAGLPCIGVETGGTDGCRLSAAGAVEVHASCAALLEAARSAPGTVLGPLLGS